MMKTYRAVIAAILATALVACGGGGGSAGSNPNTTTTPGTTTTTTDTTTTPTAQSLVADFALFTDKTTINNTGTDAAKVTVVAVDANRNVVTGAPVSISTDADSFFVPTSTATDATGSYSGNVQAGADKTDRDITVTATVNGIVKKTTVRVTGSKLELSSPAAAVNPGANVVVTASLTDSSGNPIRGQSVRLGGTIPAVQSLAAVTTNAAGQAVFPAFAAPAVGTYTISASGGGTTAVDYTLSVFTAGAVPAANIPVGAAVPSFASTPKVLAVNAPGSTTNKSTVRFQFININTPIPNVRVQFLDLTPGSALGTLSTPNGTTLYTDSSGTVTTQYVPGSNSSATDGVRLRACYGANDFTVTDITNCRNGVTTATVAFTDALLTIAGQALSISIGDDNQLSKGAVTYVKKFAVTVSDSAGRAVANAPVDISVDLTHYGKGPADATYGGVAGTGLTLVPLSLTQAFPAMDTNPVVTDQRIWCPNEDWNRNGIVDTVANGTFGPFVGVAPVIATENYNGSVDNAAQATFDPRKSDLIVSYDDPTVTSTNSSGVLIIKIEYAQRFASWIAYKVRVTTNVAGSQGVAERTFVTDFLDADKLNGSFLTPPYGTGSCLVAN